ncbi:MAG: hypothetical protein AAF646_08000 [Pseudomonadota bacterium]
MRGLILFCSLLAALAAWPFSAIAQTRSLTQTDADSAIALPEPTLEARVIESLRGDGWVRIERDRTLLGRVRITALRTGNTREIVLNPHTSEILRDLELGPDGAPAFPAQSREPGTDNAN